MVLFKLLHLLRKDALLVWRSKIWTLFEVMLPLILIATPPILIVSMTKGKTDFTLAKVPAQRMNFTDLTIKTCGDEEAIISNYLADSPFTWNAAEKGIATEGKERREEFIENARECGKAIYIMEANLSSTIVMPLFKKHSKQYDFLGYNYYMNKVFYGIFQQYRQLAFDYRLNQEPPRSARDEVLKQFDVGLYSLPKGESNPIGVLVFLFFPLFFGICLLMPVISVTRTVTVEKESVKPYLSTIGLPIWLFYIEHFLFGVIKTSILITLTSLIWVACISGFSIFIVVGIFCYTLNSIAFAVFFSAIFPSPKRIVEGLALVWITTVLLTFIINSPSPTMIWVLSLLPTSAFKNFLTAVTMASDKDSVSFISLFQTKIINAQPAAVFLGLMLFNTIWMMIAAIFMDQLLSFLKDMILRKVWGVFGNRKGKSSMFKTQDGGGKSTILNVQEKLDGRGKAAADIELNGLVKVYGNGEKAVNGLSLRAIRGQVSILLGHNGCGKSTTFGMITGMHKPTKGKVIIGGIDANSNRSEARKLIGYCSQYNPLYDKLTVMEHLRLVNALKGGSRSGFKKEAESLLEQIKLTDKKDTLAKNLSGGMKRKLCVCMAMIGNSRVILLDEPTAGMDPAARIDVQKMLALVKTDRTILLTTHYMDEAEKLGDWVFVMSHGKMAASGSIHYLKQKYGGGMLLTLVFKTSSDPKKSYEAAIQVCKAVCPSATVKDERGQMMEITISEKEKNKLPTLFKALEAILEHKYTSPDVQVLGSGVQNQARKLDLVTIGVSMSSLEQVFIKIGDECDAVINKTTGKNRQLDRKKKFTGLIYCKKQPIKKGFFRGLSTVRALLEKRAYYLYRNPSQILLQIILPLATLWIFADMFRPLVEDPVSKKMLSIESLDLSEYPQSTIAAQVEDGTDTRLLDYLYSFPNLNVMEVDYTLDVEEVVEKYNMGFQKLGFVIKVSSSGDTTIYFDKDSDDDRKKAILMNLMASCMYLKTDLMHKLPYITSNIYWMADAEQASYDSFGDYASILILLSTILAGVIIQSIVYLIEERICKFAHQQYLTGLSTITYWAVVFLWDFILFTIILLYVMAFVFAFGVLVGHEHEIIILFYCFLFYLAPVVYLTANLINSPTKGSFLLYMFCIISYFSFFIAFISLMSDQDQSIKAKWGIRFLSPSTGFFMGILKVIGIAYPQTGLTMAMGNIKEVWEFEGIMVDVIFLLAFAFILTVLLCCVTMKSAKRACFSATHRKSKPKSRKQYKEIEPCAAVAEEEALIPKVNKKDKVLVVDGLIKDFGKFRAVNGLSVSVGNEECFGMLGANGAGKTTTFDIITGLTMPTGGNVTIEAKNITETIHIGYCPQFDAMLQQISCRQTLRIMARLQGYPNVSEVVETVLECVGMKEHGYKLVKNCSGGQKRKISVGIALMSRANCIILDEPTAGIDPRARREIWDIIHEMREQGKCSIVLTSHSMEECEALCNRIGILRKGEMIALGTSQTLKSQYGNTYMMTLILHNMNDRTTVCQKVQQLMPGAVLKTPESSLTTTFVWEIPKRKSDKWSLKYQEVAALASRVKVRDYMLTQASLEDTFIRLITTEEKENEEKRKK